MNLYHFNKVMRDNSQGEGERPPYKESISITTLAKWYYRPPIGALRSFPKGTAVRPYEIINFVDSDLPRKH